MVCTPSKDIHTNSSWKQWTPGDTKRKRIVASLSGQPQMIWLTPECSTLTSTWITATINRWAFKWTAPIEFSTLILLNAHSVGNLSSEFGMLVECAFSRMTEIRILDQCLILIGRWYMAGPRSTRPLHGCLSTWGGGGVGVDCDHE